MYLLSREIPFKDERTMLIIIGFIILINVVSIFLVILEIVTNSFEEDDGVIQRSNLKRWNVEFRNTMNRNYNLKYIGILHRKCGKRRTIVYGRYTKLIYRL